MSTNKFLFSSLANEYLGFSLLICALVPKGEKWSLLTQTRLSWRYSKFLYFGVLLVFCLSLWISGFEKLGTEGWRTGLAIKGFWGQSLFSREWTAGFSLGIPNGLAKGLGAFVPVFQVSAIFLFFVPRIGFWVWLISLSIHLLLLAILNITPVSLVVILLHILLFNQTWLNGQLGRGGSKDLGIHRNCRFFFPS